MKVIILGSGVIGTTTAYVLGQRGHQVTVIERQKESALETSFANGGQLSYTHIEPWANPYVLPKIAKWLFKKDAPLIFRLRADPHMIAWGLRFLSNCTTDKAHANARRLLRLGLYSKQCLAEISEQSGVEFDHLKKGILHLYVDQPSFAHARKEAAFEDGLGVEEQVLSARECLDMEPALAHARKTLIGGIYHSQDESGDVRLFTQGLATLAAERYGVTFHYRTDVQKLITKQEKVHAVRTSAGELEADAFVMSMGSYSPIHLRPLGIRVPIYPMKGYSITVPIEQEDAAPSLSITYDKRKVVMSHLGNRLRAAGTAEIAGYDTELREARIKPILDAVECVFPLAADYRKAEPWTGLRPATPEGLPVLGRTKIKNLYLNTGHGTLGWTMACGSARVVADIVEGHEPAIDLEGLTVERF